MTVFGICMVRDAEDIIGPIVEHMMDQVDHVIVADNLSVDNTRPILDAIKGNLTVIDDHDPTYRQSEKMTHLAMIAKKQGADFVVPFDADEYWSSKKGTLKDVIESTNVDLNVAWVYDYVPTGVDWDTIDNPIKRIKWRRKSKTKLHKVACRTSDVLTIHMGNHNAEYYGKLPVYDDGTNITVKHFPYRNAEQFVNKAVVGAMALELTDLDYAMGAHWRDYARIAEEQGVEALKDVFRQWFYEANPYENPELIYDPI